MRRAGRTAWNEDDYNAAAETFNKLMPDVAASNPHRPLREVLFGKRWTVPEDFDVSRTFIDPKYGQTAARVTRSAHGAVKDVRYKGQTIRFDGNYWRVPSDPESGFESPREAKQFIDAQARNPSLRASFRKGASDVAGLAAPQTYAGMAGEAVGGVLDKAKKLLNPTDRAYRYRANNNPPPGPPICSMCGSKRDVMVGHIDGHEENQNRH